MKKIIIAVLLVAFAASASFAGAPSSTLTATAEGTSATSGKMILPNILNTTNVSTVQVGKCSTGVYVGWNTTVSGYSLETQHSSGVKTFGTAWDSTAITWKTAVKGDPLPALSSNGVSAVLASGWSVM
jgi:hypothetical protein